MYQIENLSVETKVVMKPLTWVELSYWRMKIDVVRYGVEGAWRAVLGMGSDRLRMAKNKFMIMVCARVHASIDCALK